MKKVYDDAFVIHDESEDNYKESQKFSEEADEKDDSKKPDLSSVKTVSGSPQDTVLSIQ